MSTRFTNKAQRKVQRQPRRSVPDPLNAMNRFPDPVRMVARVYGDAPVEMRRDILISIAKPLGVLSLVAIANGVFSRAVFEDPHATPHISLEQIPSIALQDVWTLIDFSYQVSGNAFNELAQLIAASPSVAATASALLLLGWIAQRKDRRRSSDYAG